MSIIREIKAAWRWAFWPKDKYVVKKYDVCTHKLDGGIE